MSREDRTKKVINFVRNGEIVFEDHKDITRVKIQNDCGHILEGSWYAQTDKRTFTDTDRTLELDNVTLVNAVDVSKVLQAMRERVERRAESLIDSLVI